MNDAYLAAGMLTAAAGLIIGAAWRHGFIRDVLTRVGVALVILSVAVLAFDIGKGLSSLGDAFKDSGSTAVAPDTSAPTYTDSDGDGIADELDADPMDPSVQ